MSRPQTPEKAPAPKGGKPARIRKAAPPAPTPPPEVAAGPITPKTGDTPAEPQTEAASRARLRVGPPSGPPDKAVLDALAVTFPPEDIVARLQALMEASTEYATKDGGRYFRPDHGVRLKAVETVIAYLVGRPIERQQVIHAQAPQTMDDIMGKAAKSPVFRRTLRRLLDQMEDAPPAAD